MKKLKMHSPNFAEGNIARLADLFPGCVTESKDENGNLKKTIDFDLLRQELSTSIVEGPRERYHLNWPGKREALLTANAPIAKTLRPCREESVDFDTTENLFIEGDNLDALKLLQETYLGKVKMIYIDPPYNTGKDFVYADNFAETTEEYLLDSGQRDEEGNRLVTNTDSNGRFHSDWLSMMYSRLKLARNLLKDDGVIFISIDDGEAGNTRKLSDEVFGGENFIANVIWEKKYAPSNDAKWLSDNHDHIFIYAREKELWRPQALPRSEEQNKRYTNRDEDPRGAWKSSDLTVKSYSANYDYPITLPSGRVVNPSNGRCWVVSKEKFQELMNDNRIWFGENGETAPDLDIGFRVLKVDSSNMADVYYTPDAVEQMLLTLQTDNIKEDRTSEDLLFQVLLDWGVDLTLPITRETIDGREVFFVDGNALAACFEKGGKITENFCKQLAVRRPLRVVFRDSGFKDDSVKINVEQIFRLMSPHTEVKAI